MAYKHWSLDDLPWDQIDPHLVDLDTLQIIKAAALVEYNAGDYGAYLENVFAGDAIFIDAVQTWVKEEVQHGAALGKWAGIVDPAFRLEEAFALFRQHYRVNINATQSLRGSRCGELVARCMVETGTSSYYTAIADRAACPVLKRICQHIAADEHRHYKLFYDHLKRYLAQDRLGRFSRLRIALGRIAETEDDELAYAFWAANSAHQPYDQGTAIRAYSRRAYSFYQRRHVERGVAMIFKACGFNGQSWIFKGASRIAWWMLDRRVKRLAQAAA
ncbi:MAG: ferritin-like domain-containing protein [Azospirillaceae bacterium]|nr:ferritin-like domain-containing protein [Azospirillaceae bacterium]